MITYRDRFLWLKTALQGYRSIETVALLEAEMAVVDPAEQRLYQIAAQAARNLYLTDNSITMHETLERALAGYGILCHAQNDPMQLQQHKILMEVYVMKPSLSIRTIAQRNHMHPRTVYKNIDAAMKDLMIIMFGVDGIAGFDETEQVSPG